MKRILVIGMTHTPGGVETYMINIFSILHKQGFKFYFVSNSSQTIAYNKFIKEHGGIVYNLFNSNDSNKLLNLINREHIIRKFLSKHHFFDVIHVNALSIDDIYWAKIAKKYGIRNIIIQSHNSNIIYNSKIVSFMNKFRVFLGKRYLNHNTDILKLAASKKCGKWLFGKGSHFTVIKNGININKFKPSYAQRLYWKRKLGISNKYKIIITTARLNKQKNYPRIIKIFNYIHNIDHLIKLVIVGSGKEYLYIKRMVKILKLTNDVIFMGQQDRNIISQLLNIGDLMLMPSLYEGLPFSLIEDQSIGVPAIASTAVPSNANITGLVKFMSLKMPNKIWAQKSLNILNQPYNLNMRKRMNTRVKLSQFNIVKSINNIKKIYLGTIKL